MEKAVASCGEAGESASDNCVVGPGVNGIGTLRAVGEMAISRHFREDDMLLPVIRDSPMA